VRSPGTTNLEETVATDATCLFCRIVRGEIPATIECETPDLVAFRDINPQSPYHVVIVPRDHIATLNDAGDPALVGRLAMAAAALAKREGYAERGYRAVINTNAEGGQTVYHLHVHLLAGRQHGWPPG
jgi:histidine triad (HIT) family protein